MDIIIELTGLRGKIERGEATEADLLRAMRLFDAAKSTEQCNPAALRIGHEAMGLVTVAELGEYRLADAFAKRVFNHYAPELAKCGAIAMENGNVEAAREAYNGLSALWTEVAERRGERNPPRWLDALDSLREWLGE